jgi:ABC-type dipeptide/oligopeptide/nickel transport system permease subunit
VTQPISSDRLTDDRTDDEDSEIRSVWNLYLIIGASLILCYLILAIFGNYLAPYDYNDQDLMNPLAPPSWEHPFGTDPIGRDLLSRIIIGTRYTLWVAIISVLLATVGGVALGLLSGFLGGRVDAVITTIVDLFLTIPLLILAIAIASVAGAGMTGLIVATSISFTPPLARLIRGRVLEIREEEFIQAALAIGARTPRILLRHLLPNTLTVIFIQSSLFAGRAILVATALGFLGLGVRPPIPEWGTLLGGGREYLEMAPHLVVAPGLAISLLVLAFNLLGDGLRDHFDPRAKI